MTRRLLLWSTIVGGLACAGGHSNPGTGAAPAPGAAPTPTAAPARTSQLQLVPSTMRYLVRQDVHVQQDFAGLPPTIDLRYGLYLTATIAEPADSIGFPASFTIDSVAVDSGSQLPPQINLAAAKGFRVSGRLAPSGEFISGPCDTSSAAASLGSLLPRFRSFLPRLPMGGVRPDTTWTDSTSATDTPGCSSGATITTHSSNHHTATTWENHDGIRALRLETTASYTFGGAGEQGGAPFTIDGAGTATGLQYVSSDGRYLGGESRDSTTLTIDLPAQGISIPRRQLAHTTVTALPK